MRVPYIVLIASFFLFSECAVSGAQDFAALEPPTSAPVAAAPTNGSALMHRIRRIGRAIRNKFSQHQATPEATIYVVSTRGVDHEQRSLSMNYYEQHVGCGSRPDSEGSSTIICDTLIPGSVKPIVGPNFFQSINPQTGVSQYFVPRPDIFLFVHGFNNSEKDAITRAASLARNMQFSNSGVVFTWPSAAQPADYLYDLQSAIFSRDRLAEVIVGLSQTSRLHIFAHSMGCWLTMEALRQSAIAGQTNALNGVASVFLISPDIDADVFEAQLTEIGATPTNFASKITVLAGEDDLALQLSGLIASKKFQEALRHSWFRKFKLAATGIIAYKFSDIKSWASKNFSRFISNPRLGQMNIDSINARFGAEKFGIASISTTSVETTDEMRHFKADNSSVIAAMREDLPLDRSGAALAVTAAPNGGSLR
jgi:esterase/lipase superfamily enzyme